DCSATPSSPLSLHDALPISPISRDGGPSRFRLSGPGAVECRADRHPVCPPLPSRHRPPRLLTGALRGGLLCRSRRGGPARRLSRSEEHTSELQSRENLVCRL